MSEIKYTKNLMEIKPSEDLSTTNGRAIVWHLREGHDNAKIGRAALAAWLDSYCDDYESLKAQRDELARVLRACADNLKKRATVPGRVTSQILSDAEYVLSQ